MHNFFFNRLHSQTKQSTGFLREFQSLNVANRVRDITQGKGANVVFETVGGDLLESA
jgi:NADPH:quinone reductase-like Zn-dependent oxidoreductase